MNPRVAIVGAENVLNSRDETLVYECDGYVVEKSVPDVVVFPTSTEQVVEVVKLCNQVIYAAQMAATAEANLALNSPNVRCSDRSSIRPKAAASQKAVEPPLPRTTS